jgi:hypothetical protein
MERRERSPRGELEKARQRLIDYGEKAPLDSTQWQAFEDSINLWEAVNIAVHIGGKEGSSLVSGITGVIEQRQENPEYLAAWQEVDAAGKDFIEKNGNQLRRQFGTFAQGRRPRFLSIDVSVKELMKIRDRIKAKKSQQPPTSPQQ